MPVTPDADRMAQLNALAGGGTAGLNAYQAAQAAIGTDRTTALNNALQGGFSAGAPNFADRITAGTQYLADAATNAVNASTAQVGFDSKAIDSFMAQQQQKYGNQQAQADATLALSDDSFDQKLAFQTAQSQLQFQNSLNKLGVGLSPQQQFGRLPLADQKLIIEGLARRTQKSDLSAQAQNTGSAVLNTFGAKAAQGVDAFNASAPGTAVATAGSTFGAQAAQGVDAFNAPIASVMAAGPNLAGPGPDIGAIDRFLQTLASNQQESQLDLAKYQRGAATSLGWSPILAEGVYPTTNTGMAKEAADLNALSDAAAARSAKSLSQTVTANSQERKLALQLAGLAGGMSESEARRIADGANIAPDKLADIFRGQAWGQGIAKAQAMLFVGQPDAATFVKYVQWVNHQTAWSPAERLALISYNKGLFGVQGITTNPYNPNLPQSATDPYATPIGG